MLASLDVVHGYTSIDHGRRRKTHKLVVKYFNFLYGTYSTFFDKRSMAIQASGGVQTQIIISSSSVIRLTGTLLSHNIAGLTRTLIVIAHKLATRVYKEKKKKKERDENCACVITHLTNLMNQQMNEWILRGCKRVLRTPGEGKIYLVIRNELKLAFRYQRSRLSTAYQIIIYGTLYANACRYKTFELRLMVNFFCHLSQISTCDLALQPTYLSDCISHRAK
ncbi:hypothetical protein PUN28_004781 [Cardiocondyla obscurior]|uniref:Uncharacterized protein n=1 Tax=Cardiocondyla obscurior TaxID=286306 RepID=A0AAW2GCJ1_9HYME